MGCFGWKLGGGSIGAGGRSGYAATGTTMTVFAPTVQMGDDLFVKPAQNGQGLQCRIYIVCEAAQPEQCHHQTTWWQVE